MQGLEKSEKFRDRIAGRYARQAINGVEAYHRTLDRTKKYLRPDDTVLDYGCGTGSISIEITGYVSRINAIDLSSRMIAIAKRRASGRRIQNTRFSHTTIDDAMLEKESFDVILAFHVLHLLEDTQATLHRVSELLKPDGLLISITPCLGESRMLFSILLPVVHALRIVPYVRLLELSELDGLIAQQGFETVEKESSNQIPPDYFVVARKL